MKKLITLLLLALCIIPKAQITFEHAYDTASTIYSAYQINNQLTVVHFEVSGDRYVKINKVAKTIDIYDMSHALVKSISFASYPPDPQGYYFGMGLYLSENLFDLDPEIEFMYTAGASGATPPFTTIYNEDGAIIFSDTCAPVIHISAPGEQKAIYNTTNGTKMILSCRNGQAKVYGLAGTLSTAIESSHEELMENYTQFALSNPYPNPSTSSTTIDYVLPKGIHQGEIVFFNLEGKELKRFKVDNTFSNLIVSTTDIPAGTYLYQLRVAGDASAAKRMVVIR